MTANEKLFIAGKLVIMTGRLCKPGIRQGKITQRKHELKVTSTHLCLLVDHLLKQRKNHNYKLLNHSRFKKMRRRNRVDCFQWHH